jgi:hypothetical protein
MWFKPRVPSIEVILAQFGTRANELEPSLSSFTAYFPEASVTLYTDQTPRSRPQIAKLQLVRPPFSAAHDERYGWRCSDLYKVRGLLQSSADLAIAVDCDMYIVSDEVRTIIPLTQRFGLCLPANPRMLVKIDTAIGADTDGVLDDTRGCGFAVNSTPIAFFTRHRGARRFLESFAANMERNPVRAPLALWRACWTSGFNPYLLPFQWCVCQEQVGIGNEIILHTGHAAVCQFYNLQLPGKFYEWATTR